MQVDLTEFGGKCGFANRENDVRPKTEACYKFYAGILKFIYRSVKNTNECEVGGYSNDSALEKVG